MDYFIKPVLIVKPMIRTTHIITLLTMTILLTGLGILQSVEAAPPKKDAGDQVDRKLIIVKEGASTKLYVYDVQAGIIIDQNGYPIKGELVDTIVSGTTVVIVSKESREGPTVVDVIDLQTGNIVPIGGTGVDGEYKDITISGNKVIIVSQFGDAVNILVIDATTGKIIFGKDGVSPLVLPGTFLKQIDIKLAK